MFLVSSRLNSSFLCDSLDDVSHGILEIRK